MGKKTQNKKSKVSNYLLHTRNGTEIKYSYTNSDNIHLTIAGHVQNKQIVLTDESEAIYNKENKMITSFAQFMNLLRPEKKVTNLSDSRLIVGDMKIKEFKSEVKRQLKLRKKKAKEDKKKRKMIRKRDSSIGNNNTIVIDDIEKESENPKEKESEKPKELSTEEHIEKAMSKISQTLYERSRRFKLLEAHQINNATVIASIFRGK